MSDAQGVGAAGQSPIVVVGMHRSGTSCLAGSLEEAGLYLGAVNTKAPFNARGNRENRAIMDLHDAVLADNGAAWDAPVENAQWSDAHRAERDRIIASYPPDVTWGFKEPRSLFTLEGWLERFPRMRLVGTFRHPSAVAASLAHRNGFSTERGLALWLAYNQKLLAFHRRQPFPVVDFGASDTDYRAALRRVVDHLGLVEPDGGFAFFTNALRKSGRDTAEAPLPGAVAEVLGELRALAA